ncbi:hypothetical protein [Sphingobacterium multivorum]|uniref:hypothetical protein n=1 Tax=Sphingobacterium multivorum TaxID=28454 RepID=UPI0028B0EE31|nr:hypothetical protein [Sphingobacterium multivorum]
MKLIDYDKAKNEIIREIAESNDFHNVVRNICRKNGFTEHSDLINDIKHEVIEKMLKIDSKIIYEYYCDNHKRPFAIAYGIAKKQFNVHPTIIGYNKQSFGTYISFTSNIKNNFEVLGNDAQYRPKWQDDVNIDDDRNDDADDLSNFDIVYQYLESDEKEFLKFVMDESITKGKYTKEYKEQRQKIFDKIKSIFKEKKLKRL